MGYDIEKEKEKPLRQVREHYIASGQHRIIFQVQGTGACGIFFKEDSFPVW